MSSLLRQLHRVFSASRPAAAAAKATPLSSVKVQKNLQTLVQSLKPSTGEFRRVLHSVRYLSAAGHSALIEEVIQEQKQHLQPEKEQFAAYLIEMYGAAGMFDKALELFDEMPALNCPPSVWSLNCLLKACINCKRFDAVERLFRELPVKLSVKPNVVTYNTLINAYCQMGSVDRALSLIDEISENGLELDLLSYAPLLNFFYGSSSFEEGDSIWDLMESKNVSPNATTYHIKMHAMIAHDRLGDAVELFGDMVKKNVEPDVYCYNSLIFAFCKKGDAEEVKRWYQELRKSNCSPDFMTMSRLIPYFHKQGDLELAYELCVELMSMRFRASDEVVQKVVNDLVRQSKVKLAEELVMLGSSASSSRYNLKMPSDLGRI